MPGVGKCAGLLRYSLLKSLLLKGFGYRFWMVFFVNLTGVIFLTEVYQKNIRRLLMKKCQCHFINAINMMVMFLTVKYSYHWRG